jgi:rubrerythrin
MDKEHSRMLKAIETAMQMEKDGKQFYLEAAEVSSNDVGKSLFRKLASEEDIHLSNFVAIYDSIRADQGWPAIEFKAGELKEETLFSKAEKNIIATRGELEAVKQAMDMENKTVDYYVEQSGSVQYETAKKFYNLLAEEERKHHQMLLDYYEYVQDPAGWFTMKEHHSLDGG